MHSMEQYYQCKFKPLYLTMKVDNEDFETILPLTKFVISNGEIKKRNFYTYNSDNILIEEIEDNGISREKDDLTNVTRRRMKRIEPREVYPYGLADTISEYYYDCNEKKVKLLKKEKYEYAENCKVVKKHIFGSDDKLKYTLNYEYNLANDNLISETDPLGRKAIYTYDENHNKVYEKTFANKQIDYEYDFCNKLISKTIKDTNESFTEEFEYDGRGNKTLQKDIYGNITQVNYDSLGNVIEEILPNTQDFSKNITFSKKCFEYDSLSRLIKKTDANNNSTQISYNIFNKPVKIDHPNKTLEAFEYNLDGTLKHHIDQTKTKIECQYDYFQRVTSKRIISPSNEILSEEFFEYDAFNIISKTDPDGNITKYAYDGAGRKVKEEIFSKENNLLSKEEFFYDELGFLQKTINADSLIITYERDFLGRILKEIKKDINGNDLEKIEYQFNDEKNKKTTISYISSSMCKETKYYDSLDRIIKIKDPLKNVTTYHYDQYFNELLNQKTKMLTIENPMKQKIVKIYDALDREKIIKKNNPKGEIVSFDEKLYDLNGNLTYLVSSIYTKPQKLAKTITTKWTYDEMNRVIELTEGLDSHNKTTKYSYADNGLVETITKPDQNVLYYEYDQLNNNTRIYSSKKDIDYFFEYNKLNQIVLAKDLNNNLITKRKYDPLGNLLEEYLSNDLFLKNEYDLLNNKIKTTFQDGSFVEYRYDPIHLKQIIRKDKNGFELYRHEYLSYDLSNNLLKEKLVLDADEIEYSYDKLFKITQIKTKFHNQKAEYDSIGRISTIHWENFLDDTNNFTYDDLNQLTCETGLFTNSYQYDSHGNRLFKNDMSYQTNGLNQIQSIDNTTFDYDQNGNPINKNSLDDQTFYEFDSLDRLIKIENSEISIKFEYDPFNRRISKISKCNSFFKFDEYRYFLYDDQNEIGSFDEYFNQKELRILSNTNNAEIKSAISFEIDGYIYAPIYDIAGNVVSLIYNGSLYEHYRYSAFGERKVFSKYKYEIDKSSINNPWQFSSKRIDEETSLIYYGRRYYDPKIGRWITPDPEGFLDGLNLYSFVLNNPLVNIDLYGLMMLPPLMLFPSQSPNTFSDTQFSYPKKTFDTSEFTKKAVNVLFKDTQVPKMLYNDDPTRRIDLGLKDFSDGRNIGATFGIRTTSQEATEYAKIISKYAGDQNVHLLHNETRGGFWDSIRAAWEVVRKKQTKSVIMQRDLWRDYLSKSDKNYLHICQSEGTAITRNALFGMTPEERSRMDIVAIAPSAYIDRHLCNSRKHYVSRDFVPYIDCLGYLRNKDSVVLIKPHPNAKLIDHNFNSPSYEESLQFDIKRYMD
ncbi:MAG: putative deoxyribonuclease RhsA [Candidatus Anoxychlamydiales bacterium]|nr:putative deoxyribonuclease RhsA [Candidatus Anoxychlamydiales bacterium]